MEKVSKRKGENEPKKNRNRCGQKLDEQHIFSNFNLFAHFSHDDFNRIELYKIEMATTLHCFVVIVNIGFIFAIYGFCEMYNMSNIASVLCNFT